MRRIFFLYKMKIEIDIKKSVEQNAEVYYNRGKKAKSKIEGVKKIIEQQNILLAKQEREKDQILKQIEIEESERQKRKQLKERKKQWNEKFRWFITTDQHLAIG